MSSNDSDLSDPHYGYDFVVATTQGSINATLKEFLAAIAEPVTTACYVADDKGHPVSIDYAKLKQQSGVDPFAIPANVDAANDTDIKKLISARFMFGFQAQLGLPPMSSPQKIPDIVDLGGDTATVGFNLLCAEFAIVNLTPPGGYNTDATWDRFDQQKDAPWIFSTKVDLRLSTVDQSAYSKLPPDVQQQIKNLGDNAFSVQQLLYDLDNAALETVPTIEGVKPGTLLYTMLEQDFVGAYFTQMQKEHKPLMGVMIAQQDAPPATLTLTDFNFQVSPFLGSDGQEIANPTKEQRDLATLNYLCAADKDALPPPVKFGWNWVDTLSESDGVIAINRNTFGNYFYHQLKDYVPGNCMLPSVSVWESGFLGDTTNYKWSLTPGQSPTVTQGKDTSGATVLTFHYAPPSQHDEAHWLGEAVGGMTLSTSFDLSVTFQGNTITISQHLVVYAEVWHTPSSGDKGNVVDKTINETYTLDVDQNGRLVTSDPAIQNIDNSYKLHTSGFLAWIANIQDLENDIQNWLKCIAPCNLKALPVSIVDNFVFPGGKTFTYKNVNFSDHQDLVSHITYTQPG
ncbi:MULTISPECIES: hypothetical protein [Nocardia]|uniref:Uncharacterized protein n=1 Tax=Nocardia sputorum TaxID=2984338 RepID=A0ABN6U193_9NOCA|nr:hypothetical protein [Nocardia sputorum]BDT90369.1 hypothetical protein IFM12275_03450 [Nocardia sputorum]BDT98988.1 hypothetical protein IFM12276_20170 [Nocardia sputorum]